MRNLFANGKETSPLNNPKELAPGLAWLSLGFVNLYFVGEPEGPWILVDTGIPAARSRIIRAAAARFGKNSKPEAILLSHGHFDHSGSAVKLAAHWDVPVYVHPYERPYVTGKCPYPAPDPGVGGFLALMSRFMPPQEIDLGSCVEDIPAHGQIPGMPEWRWLHTPGHTPGHLAFYREADRALIGGDAFCTTDADSFIASLTRKKIVSRPGTPVTVNWDAAKASYLRLAALKPAIAACGHGDPMIGPDLAIEMERYGERFPVPAKGKYILYPVPMEVEE
jgi:glyoxylase-like metal-dependent hydrolase (beta-lactamase superfamily II)